MLSALLDGRALTATELAYAARITPQTASTHLAKLTETGLIAPFRDGRYRYFRPVPIALQHGAAPSELQGPARIEVPVDGDVVLSSRHRGIVARVLDTTDAVGHHHEIAVNGQHVPAMLERQIAVVRRFEVVEARLRAPDVCGRLRGTVPVERSGGLRLPLVVQRQGVMERRRTEAVACLSIRRVSIQRRISRASCDRLNAVTLARKLLTIPFCPLLKRRYCCTFNTCSMNL